ncbi:MAG: prepilin-type N-terminal cleavage/methylation domain-containing protein [Elusimicrobia bacterium]|nr:prepilin-type N-terminal cleavage/methylation domain-containing protein [Elusimicrobiota bacterium]
MKIKNKTKGFTLIELVITIMIIVILSMIVAPGMYRHHVLKAQMSEGYALLGVIRDAQIRYYGEYDNFLYCGGSIPDYSAATMYTSFTPVLNISASANKWFNKFNVGFPDAHGYDMKYYFRAVVTSQELNTSINLYYNETSGQTFK